MRWSIDMIRTARAEHLVGAFSEYAVVTHVADKLRQIVVVDQLGVAKDARLLVKQLLDLLAMQFDLRTEFLARIEKGQRVVISFLKEFNTPGLRQRLKCLHNLRGVMLELLKRHAGERKGHAEFPLVAFYQFQQQLARRKITLAGDFADDLGVLVIVEVMPVRVKNAVATQPKGLMHLKVEANRGDRKSVV